MIARNKIWRLAKKSFDVFSVCGQTFLKIWRFAVFLSADRLFLFLGDVFCVFAYNVV